MGRVLRVLQLGKAQIGGHDQRLAAAAAAVNDVVDLFQPVFRAALHAEVVNDQQRVAAKAGNVLVSSLNAAVQVVQHGGKVGHADGNLLFHECVGDTGGKVALARADAAPEQVADVLRFHIRPMLRIESGLVHLRISAVVVFKRPFPHFRVGKAPVFQIIHGLKVLSALLGGFTLQTLRPLAVALRRALVMPGQCPRFLRVVGFLRGIREQFVSDGMCADAAIHDTDGHNPHAHILLTVRPLDEQGKWQYKTEKEYLCMRNGEERGFTAAEFKAAQDEGWEKQYPYKVGKKKVYMVSSEADAQGLIRTDKHPKSTRYGRQNPISERWNSEEQLAAWRAAWADVSNRYLERAGREERIDHRSNAARGLDEIPTIHEGVTAQALERKGIISDRCELNRQIRADNALLRELKAEIKKLAAMIARTVPTIAEGLEKLRSRVLIFCYQLSHIRSGKSHIQKSLAVWKPELECYTGLVQQIKEKSKERKALITEKKELPIYHVKRHKALAVRITELTEELEELRSEKALLLQKFEYAEDAGAEAFRKDIAIMESGLKRLEAQEQKYAAELDKVLAEYAELKAQAVDLDPVELHDARQAIRPEKELNAVEQLQRAYGDKYRPLAMLDSKRKASGLLHEYADEQAVQKLKRAQQQKIQSEHTPPQSKKKRIDFER